MGFIMGIFIEACLKKDKHHIMIGSVALVEIIGMVIAGIVMVIGYALVDGVLAGNLITGFFGAPFNVAQFTVGLIRWRFTRLLPENTLPTNWTK